MFFHPSVPASTCFLSILYLLTFSFDFPALRLIPDLVTKSHFIRRRELTSLLIGDQKDSERGKEMLERLNEYSLDRTGHETACDVFLFESASSQNTNCHFNVLVTAKGDGANRPPYPDQRIIYVDGGFDLFASGHIEFLRLVLETEKSLAKQNGWYEKEATDKRKGTSYQGRDYPPCYIVVGIHDDETVNEWKGVNYPIMNLYERALCILGCKVRSSLFLHCSIYALYIYLDETDGT